MSQSSEEKKLDELLKEALSILSHIEKGYRVFADNAIVRDNKANFPMTYVMQHTKGTSRELTG